MLANGTTGLGMCSASGLRRAPFPPASMSAFINPLPLRGNNQLYHMQWSADLNQPPPGFRFAAGSADGNYLICLPCHMFVHSKSPYVYPVLSPNLGQRFFSF